MRVVAFVVRVPAQRAETPRVDLASDIMIAANVRRTVTIDARTEAEIQNAHIGSSCHRRSVRVQDLAQVTTGQPHGTNARVNANRL